MQHQQLILKAANLARSAPTQWADFLKALAEYKEHHRDNLLNSPLDALQVNQGRAQMLDITCNLLAKAVEDADKINGKTNK